MLHLILDLSVEGGQPFEAFSLVIWVCAPGGYFAGDNACKTANIKRVSLLVSGWTNGCTLIIEELIA